MKLNILLLFLLNVQNDLLKTVSFLSKFNSLEFF